MLITRQQLQTRLSTNGHRQNGDAALDLVGSSLAQAAVLLDIGLESGIALSSCETRALLSSIAFSSSEVSSVSQISYIHRNNEFDLRGCGRDAHQPRLSSAQPKYSSTKKRRDDTVTARVTFSNIRRRAGVHTRRKSTFCSLAQAQAQNNAVYGSAVQDARISDGCCHDRERHSLSLSAREYSLRQDTAKAMRILHCMTTRMKMRTIGLSKASDVGKSALGEDNRETLVSIELACGDLSHHRAGGKEEVARHGWYPNRGEISGLGNKEVSRNATKAGMKAPIAIGCMLVAIAWSLKNIAGTA
ncbi:hypothetical protein B0H19DRAFT_1066684 [Mycena capillaripes]|nr:hypothetical protein B0H19DRAFT_1066684 [Mycena capillaripes]